MSETGTSLKDIAQGRKLTDMSANELRMRLELAGVEYSDDATKAELAKLVSEI